MCPKVFIMILFVVANKLQKVSVSIDWRMAEQIVVSHDDGILLYSERNNELEDFNVNCNNLHELMQSIRSRTRRTLYTETDALWHN